MAKLCKPLQEMCSLRKKGKELMSIFHANLFFKCHLKKMTAGHFQQLQQAFSKLFYIKGQQHKRAENFLIATLTDGDTLCSGLILEKSLSPNQAFKSYHDPS